MEQWVGHNGSPVLHTSYNYIRKKNIIELQLTQDVPRGGPGGKKFVVSFTYAVFTLHCFIGSNDCCSTGI